MFFSTVGSDVLPKNFPGVSLDFFRISAGAIPGVPPRVSSGDFYEYSAEVLFRIRSIGFPCIDS